MPVTEDAPVIKADEDIVAFKVGRLIRHGFSRKGAELIANSIDTRGFPIDWGKAVEALACGDEDWALYLVGATLYRPDKPIPNPSPKS